MTGPIASVHSLPASTPYVADHDVDARWAGR